MQRSVELRRLSTNRPLCALIAASALSSFGDWVYLAALPIILYQATQDAALLGIAAASRLLPFFLLSMPAGVVADRFDRRGILIFAEATRCMLMLVMAAFYVLGSDVLVLILLATIAAAAGTFAMPAQSALIPQLARDCGELGLANACSTTLDNISSILGPVVAGILVLAAGLGLAFAINGISFAVVVLLLILTSPGRDARLAEVDGRATGTARVSDALRWTSIVRLATGPITLDAAISFACGALGVLPVLIAVEQLHAGEAFAGLLSAGAGIGAVAGAVAAGVLVNGGQRRGIRGGIVLGAASIGVLAVSTLPLVAVGACAVALGSLVMLDTLNITALQRHVPQAYLGRAFGLLHTSAAAWLMAGSSVPPILASLTSVNVAVLLTGVVMVGLSGISLLCETRVLPLVVPGDAPVPGVATA